MSRVLLKGAARPLADVSLIDMVTFVLVVWAGAVSPWVCMAAR
jgi:hypothetical protein